VKPRGYAGNPTREPPAESSGEAARGCWSAEFFIGTKGKKAGHDWTGQTVDHDPVMDQDQPAYRGGMPDCATSSRIRWLAMAKGYRGA